MGVMIRYFDPTNPPTPGDGIFYYYLSSDELDELMTVWPEIAGVFNLRRDNDTRCWALGSAVDADPVVWQFLYDNDCLNGLYLLSNQPVAYGG